MSVMTEARIGTGGAPAGTSVLTPTYEGDFVLDEHLSLESGRTLAGPTLHYAVYGRLNAARDNAVLVCHALSGSALVGSWWPEIFAPGAVLSLNNDFVICINMLGSCYGSTGPGSVDRETGKSTAQIFRWFQFVTMFGRRRGCWTRWVFGGCGWCWEVRSAACRLWIGPSFFPSAYNGD